MNFGKIDKYLLIGGEQPLLNLAVHLSNRSLPVRVVTSPRHAQQSLNIGGHTTELADGLRSLGVDYHISSNIGADAQVAGMIDDQTLGISISSAWIFRAPFIATFGGNLVNLHCHPLPAHRGGAGYSWDVLDDERNSSAVIHLVDTGIDTGDIVAKRDYSFPTSCKTPADFLKFAFNEYDNLLQEFVRDVGDGKDFSISKQNDASSRYWPRLDTDINGFIDWTWSLQEIESFICAFDEPYKGASTFINGQRVYLKDCHSTQADGRFHPFKNGIVYRKLNGVLHIAMREGALVVNSIKDEKDQCAIGLIHPGDRLYTPREFLDQAMQWRPVYTSNGLKQSN